MQSNITQKLRKIDSTWNKFISQYQFFSDKICSDVDINNTHFIIDLLGYFNDTLDIVFTTKEYSNYTEKFSFTISFLQAIFIQQDFVQEMLEIFDTGINDNTLREDEKYKINRDLRNELIGHPISKNRKNKLISSTFFGYQRNDDEIQYQRYHKDNKFEPEHIAFKITDIQKRHHEFLEKYLNIIVLKLDSLLNDYFVELEKLEKTIEKSDFNTILNNVEVYFESILKNEHCYDKISLSTINARKDEHLRYKNFIDLFYMNLKQKIHFTKGLIKTPANLTSIKNHGDTYYSYALEQIVLRKDGCLDYFNILQIESSNNLIISEKLSNNLIISEELSNMRSNFASHIEYFTSLNLILVELDLILQTQ